MQISGVVYKSTGSWYIVRDGDNTLWNARIKGKMKIDDEISSTNPIAVGDRVVFDVEDDDTKTGIITRVEDRRNYIVRVSPHNRNQKHVIAANLDQALIIVTIVAPKTSAGFIDRFLVTAEAYHVPCIIVINKVDILQPKHQETLVEWTEMYEQIGYKVMPIIANNAATLTALEAQLTGKTTLFSGHSGVGKSTLINHLIPNASLKTLEVSGWSGKGQHSTTFAEMFDLGDRPGAIIDTPGVKEFGMIDFERYDLSHYFPEMKRLIHRCKFNNCIHVNEPDCAVLAAVATGTVAPERYISYRNIMDSLGDKW